MFRLDIHATRPRLFQIGVGPFDLIVVGRSWSTRTGRVVNLVAGGHMLGLGPRAQEKLP